MKITILKSNFNVKVQFFIVKLKLQFHNQIYICKIKNAVSQFSWQLQNSNFQFY